MSKSCNSLNFVPSGVVDTVYSDRGAHAKMSSPLRNCFGLCSDGEKMVPGGVIHLLLRSFPSAITRFVMAVVVLSPYRAPFRALPDIKKKFSEILEEKFNPPSPIGLKSVGVGILTSLHSAAVAVVFGSIFLSGKASAAGHDGLLPLSQNAANCEFDGVSADASAFPGSSFVLGSVYHGKRSALHVCNIYRLPHDGEDKQKS